MRPRRRPGGSGVLTVTSEEGTGGLLPCGRVRQGAPLHGPVRTDQPWKYRFYTRYGTARSPYAADDSRWRTIRPALTIETSMGESAQFPYANAAAYRGISRTRRACRQQDWILYTFEKPVVCREMFLQTGNRAAAQDDHHDGVCRSLL